MTTERSKLIPSISEELIVNLRGGTLNKSVLADTLSYEGLNIRDFDELKKIHFAMAEEVHEWLDELPRRLRRLKNNNQSDIEFSNGEIRGRINWPQTKQRRYNRGYDDPTFFATRRTDTTYDIPENRVIKKLLDSIVTFGTIVEPIDENWQDKWDREKLDQFKRILEDHVYFSQLPDAEEIQITEADLHQLSGARNELYLEAYRLFCLYQDVMKNNFQKTETVKFLQETVLAPAEDWKLFELFCVFGVIRRIKSQYPDLELQRVGGKSDAIAIMLDENQQIQVYYDQTGPLTVFEKYPTPEELRDSDADEMFIRHAQAIETASKRREQFLGSRYQRTFLSGRPDFLVLRHTKNKSDAQSIQNVTIGEIKYTESEKTFSAGLRQLHEYLIFTKDADDDYILTDGWDKVVNIKGILCTDGVDTDVNEIDEIEHLTTNELRNPSEV